ncbi:phage tail fiber protein, partial [Providencia sp. PROV132]
MIYEIGTISTKANDPKITGKNTLWKNSVTKVSVGQIILIQSGNTIYQNSIRSVESDTQMTLSFPVPVALTDVKYVISITMIGSVSDGVNKATAMVTESYQLMMILNRLMTESGVIKVVLPDGTEMQLRTEKERDRLLDGKFDKAGGEVLGTIKLLAGSVTAPLLQGVKDGNIIQVDPTRQSVNVKRGDTSFTNHLFPVVSGTLMQIGDGGWMSESGYGLPTTISKLSDYRTNSVGYAYSATQTDLFKSSNHHFLNIFGYSTRAYGNQLAFTLDERIGYRCIINNAVGPWYDFYTTKNTTKDANGNLKAASPIVKLFADDIELNDESEGVEMEHLGVGHYLIKGVVGFNADGAWGINNGFVIPQDHNGKNMVLIDYEVRPDGDIEIFVF